MKGLELIDTWISRKVKNWSSRLAGDARTPELLEIRRELLNDVRNHIQPAGNGRFVFPYRTVHVHLLSDSSDRSNLLENTFANSDELQQDFRALFSEAGCADPEGFRVVVSVLEDSAMAATPRPFRIDYSHQQTAGREPDQIIRPIAKLLVLQGEADPHEHFVGADRTYLGRLKEVVSETGSVRRRNDIAFAESETSVSREHAFLTYDPSTGTYRLHDCHNQVGTSVFRGSRQLRVPRGSARGLTLQSGDEIILGRARLRFEIESPANGIANRE